MATSIPAIACLGVIGRNNNPLHTTLFPTTLDPSTGHHVPLRTPLQFSLLLSGTLDIFASRARHASASGTLLSGDFGLLHAVDDRLAAYGWETNTGVKLVAVVDMRGRSLDSLPGKAGPGASSASASQKASSSSSSSAAATAAGVGLREGELKVVFRAMQTAYVRLLQNPFYDPDEANELGAQGGVRRITSRKFAEEMRRIGDVWVPGSVVAL
ncbi:Sedlin [Truncatella angustata]|uniref:Sedlin n=1 Tax=Truncatella angustata TaxID=152316 RepID=A0A9P8ZZ24_9PEZI|nr:Sedlin [Truncatella angustata]KAH6655762.1 Sedlin [Truncatella angustata]KAH8200103.1 hypothetical protein TruAng_005724 [Truncatella angustata]